LYINKVGSAGQLPGPGIDLIQLSTPAYLLSASILLHAPSIVSQAAFAGDPVSLNIR
jgi:hypothetical protein